MEKEKGIGGEREGNWRREREGSWRRKRKIKQEQQKRPIQPHRHFMWWMIGNSYQLPSKSFLSSFPLLSLWYLPISPSQNLEGKQHPLNCRENEEEQEVEQERKERERRCRKRKRGRKDKKRKSSAPREKWWGNDLEGKKIASRTDRFEAKSFYSPFLFPFLSSSLFVSSFLSLFFLSFSVQVSHWKKVHSRNRKGWKERGDTKSWKWGC